MDVLIQQIAAKKAELDRLRPLAPAGLTSLEHYYDLELTYTSNAIEGNTLSAAETMLVIEKGITIGGKPLKDHLEAIDHYDAIRYVREIAGRYAMSGRYVLTDAGRYHFPSPAAVPALMGDFAAWLGQADGTPATGFRAHRELVTIHPFDDGNGRTSRLLMNLILILGRYPPVSVRPEDRLAHVRGLQQAQAGNGTETFERLLYERLDTILGEYLSALHEALAAPTP